MSASQELVVLLLGALMGLLGQGSRAVIGLKSMSDDARALGVSPNDLFQAARLLISLTIGILVGIAAALIYLSGSPTGAPDWHILLGFAASGYLGTDFLEGFVSRYLAPKVQLPPSGAAPKMMSAPISASAPSTPKQLVYSVILQLEPNEQLTDDTTLASLGYDDFETKEILRWAIDKRKWRGVSLGVGALADCAKVSDLTQVVTNAVKPQAPGAAG
jgi:hypothetical protein